ncbi:hypothetical protein ABIB66_008822 [Bradyrhizobium sp. F1.13.3]
MVCVDTPAQSVLQLRHKSVKHVLHTVESENAYNYRTALRPDCTCNGRDAVGLAQVDLALDPLRSGDIVATADGAMAYSGIRLGAEQAPDLTPAASYPGLTTEARARLSDMKVAPGR